MLHGSHEPDVENDAQSHQQTPQSVPLGRMQGIADQKIASGGHRDDGKVDEIPAGVEEVIRKEYDGQRAQPISSRQPVSEENGHEKAEIGRCSQQHRRMPQV